MPTVADSVSETEESAKLLSDERYHSGMIIDPAALLSRSRDPVAVFGISF